ncbi:hypothetical protein IV02_04710 [Pseudomonas syringae]|uniref:Uncharacterized protein n=2 Tax=Pseudomonas syringae TaxID=317 RepID=A0A085VF38_PSESX|nr:hypothetical protein IV02_04710 [Pseudomonas syringae]
MPKCYNEFHIKTLIIMLNLKRLLLLFVLLGASVQANAQSGLLFSFAVNPICGLASNMKNADSFDPAPFANTNGFLCGEDSVFGNIGSMFGTESEDLLPLKTLLKDMGNEQVYPENAAVSTLSKTIKVFFVWVLGLACLYILCKFIFDAAKSGSALGTLGKYPVRIFAIFLSAIFIFFGGALIFYPVTMGIFFGNGQITGKIDAALATGKLSNKLETNETFMISANSASQIFMEAEQDVSTMALFILNKYRMTKVEGAVYGSNDITKGEAVDEVIKQAKAEIKLNETTEKNVDITSNVYNLINIYNLGLSYTLTKNANYDMEYRNIWGFPTTYGTVQIGGSGSNIEQLAGGESLNDGTVGKQLNKVRREAADTLGPKYVPSLQSKKAEVKKQMDEGTFVSNNMTIDPVIRKQYADASKNIRANNIVYDELNITSPATYDIISGVAAANVFSGARGHDGTKNGEAIAEQQAWIRANIVLPLRSAVCSENWKAYQTERDQIGIFNSIPDETPMKDLSRNGKIAGLSAACGEFNPSTRKIEILGSENLVDLEEQKRDALAGKIAKDIVDASIFMGIKDSLSNDEKHDNALKYSMYLKAKEGMLGLALGDLELSNYLNAQRVKTRALTDSLYFTFNNSGIKDYNFVNKELLFGKADIDISSDEFQRVSDGFPVLPFNMLMVSSVTNVAPSSLTSDQSAKSAFNVAKVVGDLLSLELESVKLMGGMDLNKSSFDGATECKNDPTVCESNPTMSYEAGMRLMGQENLDYAAKVIAMYTVSSALIEAREMVGTVLESVTAGLGSSKIATFAKYAWSAGSVIFIVSMYGAKVISGGLMPIAYINMGIGMFCMYFLPIVKVFIMVGVIIGFGWQVALLKMFYAPWLLTRALIAGNDRDCARYLRQLGMLTFRASVAIPVLIAVYNFLGYMLDTFVPRRIIWSILTMGDGSLISQIISSGMVSIGLLWIYFQFINAMKKSYEEIMTALTGQNNQFSDDAYQKITTLINSPHLLNGLQQSQNQISNAPTSMVRDYNKKLAQNEKALKAYREQFGKIPQDSEGGTKRA